MHYERKDILRKHKDELEVELITVAKNGMSIAKTTEYT